MVAMNSIPSNLRIPFVAVEFDNSRASQGAADLPYRALLLGQKTAAGTWTADTLQKVTSADEVATGAGRGSQLHRMAKRWFAVNTQTELYVGVLADNVAGVAATGTITITGTATAAGTLAFRVAGDIVQVGVAVGDTDDDIAAAVADAFTAATDLPVTAAIGGTGSENIATTTARNKGTAGNDIDRRLNYQDGETTPAGVTVAIGAMASGATNPSLTGIIAAMGDQWFQLVAHPYTDATSLTALETEFARRFGPMAMIDGLCITSAAGTYGTLATLGNTRNSPHSVILAQPGKNPLRPPAEFAAAVAAVAAIHAPNDPARPLQTLAVDGVPPPVDADLFTNSERNLLLFDGIATTKVGAGGVVQVERVITTYKTNGAGAADTSYLDASTLLTNLYLRWSFRTRIGSRYPRHKLGNDGGNYAAGQPIMTPKLGRGEAILWFRDMEQRGLVENFDQFKADLVCERSGSDPNRLEWLLPYDLINGFIVGAVKGQFRL